MDTSKITLEYLRDYYAALGFPLTDDDLAAILPGVQAVYDGAQYLAELLTAKDEPATAFRPDFTQGREEAMGGGKTSSRDT